jgi:hypothetical protein
MSKLGAFLGQICGFHRGADRGAIGAQKVRPPDSTVLVPSARAHRLPWGAIGAHDRMAIGQIEALKNGF